MPELTSLRLGDLFFGEGYIRVTGKGDKQRLVPVSGAAREKIQRYLDDRATKMSASDVVFLNNRGTQLTRVMVFTILREAVHRAGIDIRSASSTTASSGSVSSPAAASGNVSSDTSSSTISSLF